MMYWLEVQISGCADTDLSWLVRRQDTSKSTIVINAVQAYRLLIEAQDRGEQLRIGDCEVTIEPAGYLTLKSQ